MSKRAGFFTFTIVMLGLFIVAMAPSQATPNTQRMSRTDIRECRFQGSQPGIWTPREVKRTIRCADDRWPVDLDTALYIADRESHFHHGAWNPSSGACGVFQHLERFWDGRINAFLRATGPRFDVHNKSCHNARANVLVSIRMMHQTGYSPWGM